MDTVFIEGLRLYGKHGVHEHERLNEQEFLIDIRASIDTSQAALSDRLEDTADYAAFAEIAKDVVEHNSFYLIERLGERICARIIEDIRIRRVEVTIRKPAALSNGLPGIAIVRQRV